MLQIHRTQDLQDPEGSKAINVGRQFGLTEGGVDVRLRCEIVDLDVLVVCNFFKDSS
jgi:hypothetical protein